MRTINLTVTRSNQTIARNDVELKVCTPVDVVKIYRDIRFHFPDASEEHLINWILDIICKRGIVFSAEVSGRVVGTIGFENIKLFNDGGGSDCISSVWLYIHSSYKEKHLSTMLVNMAREYANETGLMVKLNPKNGVGDVDSDIFFENQGFEPLGETYIYRRILN